MKGMKTMMRWIKRILLGIVVIVLLFVTFIGPWPTYSSGFEGTGYHKKAISRIEDNSTKFSLTPAPGKLQVGWGSALITPETGVPLAGYGDRRGKPSTGSHDDLYVKAIALSDGQDYVVLVGCDMLLVPPNVADIARKHAEEMTGGKINANNIYFTASHTHDGPGSWGPGLVARVSAGKYDAKVPAFLGTMFSNAIMDAFNSMKPGKLAIGKFKASQYIRNRARDAAFDDELNWMIAEKGDGERCYVTRFSAHPTNLDGDNMLFSAEFPGYLQAMLEKTAPRTTAVYLGGALGSSGPRAPEGAPDDFAKCKLMGEALAQMVLDNTKTPEFKDSYDIASIGILLPVPPLQVRVTPGLRISPLFRPIAGLTKEGWMSAAKIGNTYFIGVPADFSSEISLAWKQWATTEGIDLVPTSFCANYLGYVSPDKYYAQTEKYETGIMSWTGPHQEAYFTDIMKRMVGKMRGEAKTAASPQGVTPRS
jgi:hypothetical protein